MQQYRYRMLETSETMAKQEAGVSKWMRQQKLNETFSNI